MSQVSKTLRNSRDYGKPRENVLKGMKVTPSTP